MLSMPTATSPKGPVWRRPLWQECPELPHVVVGINSVDPGPVAYPYRTGATDIRSVLSKRTQVVLAPITAR